jgi:hypothetical protein
LLADRLSPNQNLLELKFSETEDHQQYWNAEARQAFCALLKSKTCLKSIKAKFQDCNWQNAESRVFAEELSFYTDQKSKKVKAAESFEERMRSC